jgi:hypothetical protein
VTTEQDIDEYIRRHFKDGKWEGDAEQHQLKIRILKQQVENEKQEAIISRYRRGKEEDPELLTEQLEAEFRKYWPLYSRRHFSGPGRTSSVADDCIAPALLRDGELFSFIAVEEQITIYRYCNCGAFPKAVDDMTQAELAFANEHLPNCKTVLEERVVEKTNPPKHKIGIWDCRACLKDLDGKSSISWCPRFLRPFRQLSVHDYLRQVNYQLNRRPDLPLPCYAGLLHVQMSVKQENTKTLAIRTEVCDTCNYKTETITELNMKQPV